MNVNSRSCDVVMARDVRTSPSAPVAPAPVETVDVSPDPAMRTIVLAPNKAEGAKFTSLQGIEPVAIVTPRSELAVQRSSVTASPRRPA